MSEKRQIRPLRIFSDPFESALSTEYKVEVFDCHTGQVISEVKHSKIWLQDLDKGTDISKYAKSIIKKSKYIPSNWVTVVEDAIHELYQRQFGECDDIISTDQGEGLGSQVNIHDIDHYLELLYVDENNVSQKVDGLTKIFQLCKIEENLHQLAQNHTLMSALSRLMSEDSKRSIEVSFIVCKIFLIFSSCREILPTLSNYRVGILAMDIVSLCVRRYHHCSLKIARVLFEEDDKSESASGMTSVNSSDQQNGTSGDENLVNKIQWIKASKQDHVVFFSLCILFNLAQDITTEKKMVKKGLVKLLTECVRYKSKRCLQIVLQFFKKMTLFEENILDMADAKINTVNKIANLFCSTTDTDILYDCLVILFNVSFHRVGRRQLSQHKRLLSLLAHQLQNPDLRKLIARLFYHLSIEFGTREQLGSSELVFAVVKLASSSKPCDDRELAALAVNVSFDRGFANELLRQDLFLGNLLKRIENHQDNILAKILRNLSERTHEMQLDITRKTLEMQSKEKESENVLVSATDESMLQPYTSKRFWGSHALVLVEMCLNTENHDLLVELLGTLRNLTSHDLPMGMSWADVLSKFMLGTFIGKLFLPGMAKKDVIIEAIVLSRRLCVDNQSACLLSNSRIIPLLIESWLKGTSESDITIQILKTLCKFLHFQDTREKFLDIVGVLNQLVVSTQSNHSKIKTLSEQCLDLVIELNKNEDGSMREFGLRVRELQFCLHNQVWIESL